MSKHTAGRQRLLAMTAAVSVAGLGLGSAAAAASAADASAAGAVPAAAAHWRVVARTDSALNTIVAPAAASAWVLGSRAGAHFSSLPSGEHWNGHRWTAAAFPKSVTSGIGCSGASSPGNVLAFAGSSLQGGPGTYAGALRLSGGKWAVSKSFSPPGLVSGCSVLGPGNAWVYGLTHVAPGVGTWRLRGRTWKAVPHTGNFALVTASSVSAQDIWAIAAGPLGLDNVVAHWNGHAWTRQSLDGLLPAPTASVLPGLLWINAVAAGDVWVSAVVETQSSHGPGKATALVLHLSGGKWHKVARTSAGYYLPGAVPDGHGGWWTAGNGDQINLVAGSLVPYLLHETGGHWRRVSLPVPKGDTMQITDVVHVPGSSAMLATGQLFNGTAGLHSVVLAFGQLPR